MNDAGESTSRLDGRIDALTQEMRKGFKKVVEQTQAGFEDHRLYSEFLITGLRSDMNARFTQVDRRFDAAAVQMDRRFNAVNEQLKSADRRFESVDRRFDAVDQRFDAVDQRFDRLERLIKGEEL